MAVIIDRKRKRNRRSRSWVVAITTMGVLIASSSGSSRALTLSWKQPAVNTIRQNQQTDQSQVQRFDIPPGSLRSVIETFSSITGWQVRASSEDILLVASPGVTGLFTPEAALAKLLAGTGISYRISGINVATLEIQAQPESVEVRDENATVISSPKYTEPLRNTPQTIAIIPKTVIEQQSATTLRDVLRNVSGLTITAGEGGNPAGDNLTLRGFTARNDIFVDGVRDLSPQSRDPFNIEQVEIVKGPGSAFSGRGSTGGAINLVNKAPISLRSFSGTLMLGTDRTKRVTGDVNLPLGDSTAFRLNLMLHDSGVAGRDVVENERWGLAPSVTFGLGKPTRFTVSYFKVKQNNISDYGIPWVPATNNALADFRDRPAPVPRNTFYGLRNRDFEKLDADLVTLKLEHSFNDSLSLRNQLRYGLSSRDSIATPPRFANTNSTAINRELRSWLTEDDIWDNQTDATAKFSTGKIEHSFVAGLNISREHNERKTRTAGNMLTTLLDPNPDDVFPGAITQSPIVGDITANSQAVYAFDNAKLGKKWELNGGLRWDRFDAEGISTTGVPVSRVDRMLSFRAAAVFKPLENGSVYASYGTALNPSLEGLSYNTANTVIDPEKTYTVEAGSKWDLFEGRLLLTGAVFRVDKTNARTPGLGPNEPPQVLQGQQRVSGMEMSASGSFTRSWQVLAGYTFLASRTVDSNTPAEIGKELVNTPRNSFNLWTTYDLPRGFSLGGGLRFVGRRFGNTTNTRWVDSYWTFDAMASFPLSKHLDLRLNLYNLTDTYYFDRIGGGHLIPGPSRSATLSTSFRF